MKRFVVTIALLATSCSQGRWNWGPDQCLRRELLKECLKDHFPSCSGSVTISNWELVIDECGKQAHELSIRELSTIPPECGGKPK